MKKELFLAIATLVGFVVGAGVLGLPYVFSRSGFITGVLNVILIGLAVMVLNLMLGEINLRTKKSHQLVGCAEKYLGKKGKKIMMLFLLLGWYGAMIAYTIKMGEFFSVLLEPLFLLDPIYYSIIFAMVGGIFIYKGLGVIKKCEFSMIIITLLIMVVIGIFCLPNINPNNLQIFNLKQFLFPFGVVLFAFGGAGAIPEMKEILKKDKKLLKKAIIIGTSISMLIYILFPLFVVGVTGNSTTDGAIIGLGNALGPRVLLIGILFGLLTMSTSFLVVGLAIKEIFKFDCGNKFKCKINDLIPSLLACVVPFIIAIIIMFLKIDNAFYKVIDINGAFIYPITSILFVLMFWKSREKGERKPEYVLKYGKLMGWIIILLFLAGFINELIRISNMFFF